MGHERRRSVDSCSSDDDAQRWKSDRSMHDSFVQMPNPTPSPSSIPGYPGYGPHTGLPPPIPARPGMDGYSPSGMPEPTPDMPSGVPPHDTSRGMMSPIGMNPAAFGASPPPPSGPPPSYGSHPNFGAPPPGSPPSFGVPPPPGGSPNVAAGAAAHMPNPNPNANPATRPSSGFRLPLSDTAPFPTAQAGPPATVDADGRTPVYVGSAIFQRAVHPCKIVPALRPPARVAYAGGEHEHRGRFDLLPLDPGTMEWVPARGGMIPPGRRPVEGGYEENGEKLYHAIGVVNGVRVPGKAGAHLRGANVAFGGGEHRVEQYDLLCWRY